MCCIGNSAFSCLPAKNYTILIELIKLKFKISGWIYLSMDLRVIGIDLRD